MKRNTVLGTVVLLAIVGGIIFYGITRPAPAEAPGTATTLSLPAGGYEEHTQYYDIKTNYATSTPLRATAGAVADTTAIARMQAFVSGTIAQFKTDGNFANLTPEDIKMMGFDQGRKETLQIAYLIASSPHTVSYIFTTYEDTLGAHGNLFFHTFTFDTSTGAGLALKDVFAPGADYLDALSRAARAGLPSVIGDGADANMIASGTTPSDKNFERFFFDNGDFVILFAPYAVASYAAGPQTLRIPVAALANILKPEYR